MRSIEEFFNEDNVDYNKPSCNVCIHMKSKQTNHNATTISEMSEITYTCNKHNKETKWWNICTKLEIRPYNFDLDLIYNMKISALKDVYKKES